MTLTKSSHTALTMGTSKCAPCNRQGRLPSTSAHHCHLHGQGQQHAQPLAEHEFPAPQRLGQDGVHGLEVELFVEQVHAHEDGDDDAEDVDAEQPDVADGAHLFVQGEVADGERRQDDQHGEEEQAVEDLVAHRFAEGVPGDGAGCDSCRPLVVCLLRWPRARRDPRAIRGAA